MFHKIHLTKIVSLGLLLSLASIGFAQDTAAESAKIEKELLAALQAMDTPAADKAITCKKLAIHGSSASVPELARLLPDPQLSSWARIALEAIPGPESSEALRKAAESLDGELLIGTLNSIGVRRDAEAVELLSTKLNGKDEEAASAAAVALGHIGNEVATKTLRGALMTSSAKVRSAVAEGCVLCAERLNAEGYANQAVEIYEDIRKADVPKQRLIEATRGAILARGQEGIPLLLEQFRSPDKGFFQLALGTFREFPGGEVDQLVAKELSKAQPDRAAMIVYALADRPETVVLPAIIQAAQKGPKQVRSAAIEALGSVGDATCLPTLLALALESDAELSQPAKASLSELPGEKVNGELVAMLPKAEGDSYPLLLELVGQRRIDAVPELLKALEHDSPEVRGAALTALGETVSLKRLPILIDQVAGPKSPEDLPLAQKALKAASVRMPDREACATELAMALERVPGDSKTMLLEILSDVGGAQALKTLAISAKSADPQLQDASSRLLGKWNGVDAAPVLLDLAKSAPEPKYQIRALRGYIGLARKFAMPEPERAEMCQQALAIAKQPAEKLLVLDVLKLHPSTDAMKLAIETLNQPQLKEQATQAVLQIAQKVKGNRQEVRQLLVQAGFEPVKLEIVKAEYGAGNSQRDVTAILQKQVSNLPLVLLPASSYNTSFGGDPLPGQVKQLKIQYKINGQPGETTFAEDAVILLPMPK